MNLSGIFNNFLSALFVCVAVGLMAPAVSQAGGKHKGVELSSFVGLWEGIDPADGSHQVFQMTPNDEGALDILLHDSAFTLCEGTDKGISEGTAVLLDDGTLISDDFTLTCFSTGETKYTPTSFYLETGHKYTIMNRVRASPLGSTKYLKINRAHR